MLYVYLVIGIGLAGAVVLQFFTQEVYFRLTNPFASAVHREEVPVLYWGVMAVELALAIFLLHRFFTRYYH
jgi:hypothetical protein